MFNKYIGIIPSMPTEPDPEHAYGIAASRALGSYKADQMSPRDKMKQQNRLDK